MWRLNGQRALHLVSGAHTSIFVKLTSRVGPSECFRTELVRWPRTENYPEQLGNCALQVADSLTVAFQQPRYAVRVGAAPAAFGGDAEHGHDGFGPFDAGLVAGRVVVVDQAKVEPGAGGQRQNP